ncbi:hypothetical protein P152DRAFT_472886 [Eremomyces bilateralis CBS 781.70]|uniref:Myb-like DNA-binding domain-containing protein n=1 Tax=Eremomyces bilateralis CBS 781.70 TaxID=1392243 RepID=A0A6G1G4Y1_9PEZI|nr:uncharacterized protein P152DRAFT_472886 [Eremomyces bilateralis CBS 781.70]KAF1813123.1 hypothetical protein P152DRAFT_472886 [Eremomyces bilateralis CBS 781.70]
MPQIWTPDHVTKLLLCIIAQSNSTATNWQAVADAMGGYSPSAVSQKFMKVKRANTKLMNQATGTASPVTSSANGSAHKRSRPGLANGSGKSANFEDDEERIDHASSSSENDQTPIKRPKIKHFKSEVIDIDVSDEEEVARSMKTEAFEEPNHSDI